MAWYLLSLWMTATLLASLCGPNFISSGIVSLIIMFSSCHYYYEWVSSKSHNHGCRKVGRYVAVFILRSKLNRSKLSYSTKKRQYERERKHKHDSYVQAHLVSLATFQNVGSTPVDLIYGGVWTIFCQCVQDKFCCAALEDMKPAGLVSVCMRPLWRHVTGQPSPATAAIFCTCRSLHFISYCGRYRQVMWCRCSQRSSHWLCLNVSRHFFKASPVM